MVKGRIFSGMQPSGNFHLGNYLGALSNWVKLQHEYECFFCIVDWHALTSSFEDPTRLPDYIHNMALDWLSAGIDPEKTRFHPVPRQGTRGTASIAVNDDAAVLAGTGTDLQG